MNKVSNRQKSIICGSLIGASSHFHNQHYNLWKQRELSNIAQDDPFIQKATEIFKNPNNEWIFKLSPLAIAVWAIETNYAFVSNTSIETTQKMFLEKWGIKTEHIYYDGDFISPESEDDWLNLWMLVKPYVLEAAPSRALSFDAQYGRNNLSVYLSGGQDFAKDNGVGWRAKVSPQLFRLGFDIINPVYETSYIWDQYGVNRPQLREQNPDLYSKCTATQVDVDLADVVRCSAVLVCWNEASALGSGTKGEVTLARYIRKPIYCVFQDGLSMKDLSTWMVGCLRGARIFDNFEEAIETLNRKLIDE